MSHPVTLDDIDSPSLLLFHDWCRRRLFSCFEDLVSRKKKCPTHPCVCWVITHDIQLMFTCNSLCVHCSSCSSFCHHYLIGYRVFLRSNNEDWKSHETLAEVKSNTHTIHGLKCGSKYQVYMLAFNEVGNSDPSESLAFSTEGGGKWSLLVSSSWNMSLPVFSDVWENDVHSSSISGSRWHGESDTLLKDLISYFFIYSPGYLFFVFFDEN